MTTKKKTPKRELPTLTEKELGRIAGGNIGLWGGGENTPYITLAGVGEEKPY
jgi:hypothetical protein